MPYQFPSFLKKHWWKLLLALGIVLAASLILAAKHNTVTPPNQSANTQSNQSANNTNPKSQEKNCQSPVFTKPLVEPDRVSVILPLGTPNRPNRTYVTLKMEPGDALTRQSVRIRWLSGRE